MLPMVLKRRWVKALRSGKYKQTKKVLREEQQNNRGRISRSYCCLGVLCEVAKVPRVAEGYEFSDGKTSNGSLYGAMQEAVDNRVEADLIVMNDSGTSFRRIATWIERHL